MDSPPQKLLLAVLKRMLGVSKQRLHGMSCESVDWNPHSSIGFAAMRLYTFLTKSNSYTMKKVLHAHMQLSTLSNDCWSVHILSAMDGLTQSYIFKQKLLNGEPIDLSRFVVDLLRQRHLEYWTPHSETHLREHNSKRSAYHQWCALPTERALVTHSPYILPKSFFWTTCFVMSFAVLLVSDFVFTPYVLRQRHGIKVSPPPVTCVTLIISKMSSMSISTAPIPTWFLSAGNMHLCFPHQQPTMCLLF